MAVGVSHVVIHQDFWQVQNDMLCFSFFFFRVKWKEEQTINIGFETKTLKEDVQILYLNIFFI